MTGTPASEQNSTPIQVSAQYIKDLSFEMPNAPAIFNSVSTTPPEVSIQVNLSHSTLKDNVFESVMTLHIEGKAGADVAFILELAYAGVFTLNVPQEHLQPVLYIECPRILFPFVRGIVSDISRESGMPPLILQPIDFLSLFRQRMEQSAQGRA